MSFIQRAWRRPRTLFLRRALFQIHLWAGIFIGLYAIAIGLSGSILVFREEINDLQIHPYRIVTVPPGGQRQGPDNWYATLRPELGPRGQLAIQIPQQPEEGILAYVFRDGGTHLYFLDPYTSRVIAHITRKGGFLPWMGTLHSNLFLQKTGRRLNGIGAMILLALIVTGLLIWWPGPRLWRRRLAIDFSARGKRINWDLHNSVGVWSLAGFALLSLTATWYTWPQFFRETVGSRWPLSPPANIKPVITPAAPPASLSAIIAAADRAAPEKATWRVQFPPNGNTKDTVRVYKLGPGMPEHRTATQIYVHPQTAEVLRVDRFANRSTGDKIIGWIAPLHSGNFGGLPVRIVYAILGIVPGLLFVTGFIMWWDRVVRRRWRSWKTPSKEEKAAAAAA